MYSKDALINVVLLFRRGRAVPPGNSPYEIQMNTLKVSGNSLQVQVVDTRVNVPLVMDVVSLQDSTVRVTLRELNTERKRFDPEDALAGELKRDG